MTIPSLKKFPYLEIFLHLFQGKTFLPTWSFGQTIQGPLSCRKHRSTNVQFYHRVWIDFCIHFRAGPAQGMKFRGGLVVLGGDNLSPLVKIGLADLPNIGGAKAPPSPHLATALYLQK